MQRSVKGERSASKAMAKAVKEENAVDITRAHTTILVKVMHMMKFRRLTGTVCENEPRRSSQRTFGYLRINYVGKNELNTLENAGRQQFSGTAFNRFSSRQVNRPHRTKDSAVVLVLPSRSSRVRTEGRTSERVENTSLNCT
uniref:Uncharacterized protein n=1 Tax=Steinernema glaseri TaxID=37863 RepID=A0A1I7Z3E6_9BILA